MWIMFLLAFGTSLLMFYNFVVIVCHSLLQEQMLYQCSLIQKAEWSMMLLLNRDMAKIR